MTRYQKYKLIKWVYLSIVSRLDRYFVNRPDALVDTFDAGDVVSQLYNHTLITDYDGQNAMATVYRLTTERDRMRLALAAVSMTNKRRDRFYRWIEYVKANGPTSLKDFE